MAYLDNNGLLYLWNKIKSTFVKQVSGKGLSTNDYTTAEKTKLSGIAAGAEVNQNTFSNVKVGSTTVAADSKTDTLELVAGSNVTLTPDATNDKVTIAAKDTVFTHPAYTAKANGLYKVTVDGTGHVSAATAVSKSDITKLGIPEKDTIYNTFMGANGTYPGSFGLVPTPLANHDAAVLCGNGNWEIPKLELTSRKELSAVAYYGLKLSIGDSISKELELPNVNSEAAGLMSHISYNKLEALPTAATLESTYAKKSDIVGMYKYKGSVTDASKLPTTGQTTGDVYNIETASAYGGAGMNVAWNGSAWDPLGEIFTITSITNAQIDTICV